MTRPLLICDCDEVILHFAGPFVDYLAEVHDMELRFESFALAGNIRQRADGAAVDGRRVPELLAGFFSSHMPRQPLAAGAAESLRAIAGFADVVVLTNLGDHLREARAAQLGALGLDLDVVTNQGPKGPAVARLLDARRPDRALFIDDLPPHHSSVREAAAHVHRLHMVADERLRTLIPAAADAHVRLDSWTDALPWIRDRLRG